MEFIKHAKFAPSSSEQFMTCLQYFNRLEGAYIAKYIESDEGSRVHEKISKYFDPSAPPPPGHDFTEREESIILRIRKTLKSLSSARYGIEKTLYCQPKKYRDLFFGTPDLYWMNPAASEEFNVLDYKNGFIPVKANLDNTQLMCYAVLIAEHFRLHPQSPFKTNDPFIMFHIIQFQRLYSFPVYMKEVFAFQKKIYSIIAHHTSFEIKKFKEETIPYTVGSHCKYCKARHNCPKHLDIIFNRAQENLEEILGGLNNEKTQ